MIVNLIGVAEAADVEVFDLKGGGFEVDAGEAAGVALVGEGEDDAAVDGEFEVGAEGEERDLGLGSAFGVPEAALEGGKLHHVLARLIGGGAPGAELGDTFEEVEREVVAVVGFGIDAEYEAAFAFAMQAKGAGEPEAFEFVLEDKGLESIGAGDFPVGFVGAAVVALVR